MFNRLIIAVLTLGLLLTFSSAAFSTDETPPVGKLEALEQVNTDAPRYSDLKPVLHDQPAYEKPAEDALTAITPTTVLPPPFFCEFIDYSGGAAAYFIRCPDAWNDYEFGVRYTSTQGYNCTLLAAYIGVYGTYMSGLPNGAPDMNVTVYADDGFGYPGAMLGNVVIPGSAMPASGTAYVGADLTSLGPLVFSDGEEFHVGASVANWEDGDTLALLIDDGTAGVYRSWENWAGYYGYMLDDWGTDYNHVQGIEVCCGLIPYSACYTQSYDCGPYYYFEQPDAYGDDYYAMRFSVEGPETLSTVSVALYGAPTVGTPDLDVFVWGDNGGLPDMTDVIYSTTVPYSSLVFYPGLTTLDLYSLGIVLTSDFHVGWSTNDADPTWVLAGLSDDGGCGTLRGTTYWGGAHDYNINVYGIDVNFVIEAELCPDQFSDCKWLYYYCGLYYYWQLPDRYGGLGDFVKYSPTGEGCRLEYFDIFLYWNRAQYAWPRYTYNSEIQIWSVDGVSGLPDTKLFGKTITPGDYGIPTPTPDASSMYWMSTDFTGDNFQFDTDVWIGIESFAPDTLHGISTLSDDGSCGQYRSAWNWAGEFGYMADDWGLDANFVFDAYVCCVPLAECTCYPGEEDWPVMGHDFARTNRSLQPLGDAQGALTKVWQYTSTQVMVYASPVIFGEYVVGYFLDNLTAIDKNSGAQIWKRTLDGFEIGGGCWATPTIYDFAAYGGGVYVFTPGGDAKAFNCIDLASGATVWTKNFMYHSNHFMTFSPSVIVDCEGVPIVIYSDDDGDVYAVEALTGNTYTGWVVNPQNFGGSVLQGLTTDGEVLYVGTDRNISNGNITAVDACTGTVLWDLASSGGLQLCNVDAPNCGTEGFIGAMSYTVFNNAPVLFAASYYDVVVRPPYNSAGVMYSVDPTDGSLNWATLCIEHDYGGIAMNCGTIIHTGWAPWIPGLGELRGPTGFNMDNGNYTFENTTTNPGLGDFWLMGGILSCEPEAFDWFVTQSRNNYVGFYRDFDGAMMWHRRWSGVSPTPGVRAGHRNVPVMDEGHLLITWRNKVVALTTASQNPRPRLDIPRYTVDVPVEFGLPDHYNVVFPGAIGNTGGAPLTVDALVLVDDENGTIPALSSMKSVDTDLIANMERIADKFASMSDNFRAPLDEEMDMVLRGEKASSSHSAFVVPSWVYGIISPVPGAQIPPQGVYNDSSNYTDIVIDVDGTQVPRGLTRFYVDVYTDDPDYFLDSARGSYTFPADSGMYMTPQIALGIVGGCLTDSLVLEFGVGAANYWTCWNAPILADGDITCHEIDGDSESFWQGSYIFALSQMGDVPPGKPSLFSARVYHYTDNWNIDGGWSSLLPDVNCFDATCPPNHQTSVYLGDISTDDGASYHAVYGEVVAYGFVDSAQDFCQYDTLGNCESWDWQEYAVPVYRDTLTAGFKGCAEVIGAYDEPLLNNFVVHRFDLEGRYAAINDLFMGAIIDWDIQYGAGINGMNVAGYDADLSISWGYTCSNPTVGWGAVKIPFGCGFDPIRGSKTITARQGGWNDSAVWLDSVYYWMSSVPGLTHQPGTDPAICADDPDDREIFHSIAELDVPGPGSQITIAVAWFGMPDIVDADLPETYALLANTANKWCGFGRGDNNNDGVIDLVDIAYLIDYLYYGGNGPFPFMHLGDVDADGDVDGGDLAVMIDYYFNLNGCIEGDWVLGGFTP